VPDRRYPASPRVGIGIVLVRGDQCLLIRRARPPAAGAWSLPGGAQMLGETAEACARRELREETGLTAGEMVLVGHADSIHHDAAGRIEYHYTILDFAARYEGGTPVAGDDAAEFVWARAQDFDRFSLWAPARAVALKAFSLWTP
jgi:ADP-ribose pyrophosphatase YjhB (NUDIX family)